MMEKRWTVGFKDRGHGHGDFAVIVEGTEELVAEVVGAEGNSLELAAHIAKVHNKWILS